MASTSGTKGPFETADWRKRLVRNIEHFRDEEDVVDIEIVPSSLAVVVPILRAAQAIEKENPRVAFLCRFHAFEKAHTMDPASSGRGVRQFKTNLLNKLEVESELTENHSRNDSKEVLNYYQQFYEKKIRDGEFTHTPEEMAENVQIAVVLYELVKKEVAQRQNIEDKTKRYAEDVERKRGQYEHYNILPLYAVGVKPAIMELPEIKGAINALCDVGNLPRPMESFKKVNDILEWIASVFGFQKGNVANQREHLILLLANLNIRNSDVPSYQLHEDTVKQLRATIFKNYESWCLYVRCESNIRFLDEYVTQQMELIFISLYLLIWGEASNIRFMPECICYIFHHMCDEVSKILDKNTFHVTGSTHQEERDEEYFLREVISPIYHVVLKEARRNKEGKTSHSKWRNYDDLNEYFWSNKCFHDLRWPLNLKADFFRHSDETQTAQPVCIYFLYLFSFTFCHSVI
ncbi:hypothetical protein Fmac_026885 [Flemingia macrophylla]|uniref:1,3-beta-glucan synthase component FKS1-like domain-containing protein n=1 Tax=Flemingia macrophylla TaxID=520843 RepID=A0ABD1LGC5_9FABA